MAITTTTTSNRSKREGYFTTRDGVKLYYTVEGDGPPIVLCSGISVAFLHWKYLTPKLAKRYRVIQWNYRGHGNSDLPRRYSNLDLYQLVDDLEQLRSHLKINRWALLGHSMGTQVILEYFKQHPDRVSALIPALGTYEKLFNSLFNSSSSRQVFNAFYWLSRFKHPGMVASWNLVHLNPFKMNFHLIRALRIIHPDKCSWEDIRPYFEHYKRINMTTFFELAKSAQEHSAADVLPTIDVPTLVIGASEDRLTPVALARSMARQIPGSKYVEIPDGSHAAFLEQPDLINKHIIEFLDSARSGNRWPQRKTKPLRIKGHMPYATRTTPLVKK